MTQSLVCLFVCMVVSFNAAQAAQPVTRVKVEYRISRIHGLWEFAQAVSETGVFAPGLKEVWLRSKYQTPEVKKAVDDLVSISGSFMSGWDFNSPVASRPDGGSVDTVLATQSMYARDLSDFAVRTVELLPMNDHRILLRSLRVLEPVYDALVWKSGNRELQTMKKSLERAAVKSYLNTMFAKAVKFYRGNWPADVPFVIGLHAIPFLKDFKNSTSSTSFSSVEVHGVQTGAKQSDIESDFGVIFHELCHSVYKSQSIEMKADLEKWFLESKSPYSRLAYLYLNEGLATALGNGWAYQRARGELDGGNWYNQVTIDTYGKALYPVVLEYLESGRSMDREFVARAIQLFGERLPDSIHKIENLTNKVLAIHNGSVLKNTDLREVRLTFRSSSYSGGAPFLAQETIDDMNKSTGALVIVVGPNDQNDFDKLATQVPFLSSRAKEIRKMSKHSYFASSALDGRLLLVIKASSSADYKAALESLKKREKLSPSQLIYEY